MNPPNLVFMEMPEIEVSTIQYRTVFMRPPAAHAAFFLPEPMRTTTLTAYTAEAFITDVRYKVGNHKAAAPTSLLKTSRYIELNRP